MIAIDESETSIHWPGCWVCAKTTLRPSGDQSGMVAALAPISVETSSAFDATAVPVSGSQSCSFPPSSAISATDCLSVPNGYAVGTNVEYEAFTFLLFAFMVSTHALVAGSYFMNP